MKKLFYYPQVSFRTFMLFVGILLLSSCSSYKTLPYFNNIDQEIKEESIASLGVFEATIKPNDILSITVNSIVAGAAVDFNLPLVPSNINDITRTTVAASSSTSGSLQNYLVDKDGKINFPVLGELSVTGKTTKQLQDHITSLIYPRYISDKPVVNVRMLNFKVSVLGEVNRPGTYDSENGQMTILDALAAAGDMTIYGKRDNVMLIRTTESGDVVSYRINMQDKQTITDKNIFYLQQNDKLYVETNKAKGNNSSFGTVQTIGLSAVSILISLIAIITR